MACTNQNLPRLPRGRARTPSVLQMEAAECGAASLAIILAYFGRIVPLAQLRRECGVSRDGSTAANVLNAAEAHGLQASGAMRGLDRLHEFRYPYIVFWNFNHFLVVEGARNQRIYLNDPTCGHRRVTVQEFADAYSGVVLAMEPGAAFRAAGRRPSVIASLAQRLQGSIGPFLMCAFAAFLLVVPGIAYPALLQAFIDRVLIQQIHGWARPVVIGLLITAVLRVALTNIQGRILRRLQVRLCTTMSSRFVSHLLRLPTSYYEQRYAGELGGRIELNDSVGNVLSGQLGPAIIDVMVVLFYLAAMSQFDGALTAINIVFAGFSFLLLRWIRAARVDGNNRLAHAAGRAAGVTMAGLQTIRTIKASALEPEFFQKWAGHFARLANVRQEFDQRNQIFAALPVFCSGAMTILVLVVGGFRVMDGELTIGQLVAFQALTASFLQPVNNLISLGSVMQMLETDLARLDDVLANPPAPQPLSLANAPAWCGGSLLHGRIEFRNVCFGYNPIGEPLIRNLSFTIQPGGRAAIVGATGSGKSTVVKLAAGLHQPDTGEILFDGVPRQLIPAEVVANSLSLVEQDITMFQGTVRENLTLWDAGIPAEALSAACRDALIDHTIAAMPHGYDGPLLEGAANLSGGQRQRLELARALASDPSILILDEPTSALDAETEYQIDRNIRRRGCTCLIAAHRLSTIRDCDEILVLNRGEVVERGSHQELLRAGGEYARLIAAEESLEAIA